MTPKQEAFVRAYLETGNASEAYRRAYNAAGMKSETIHRAAFELLENPKITARIAEIQSRAEQRHEITLDRLTEMAAKAYSVASEKGDAGGMVAAVRQLSRMHGYDVGERVNKRDPLEDLDAASRKLVLDAIDAELARREGQAGVTGAAGQA